MKSCEQFLDAKSDYFLYLPSKTAQSMFFYPLCVGHFFYKAGYRLQRESYDSFLLIYVEKGTLTLTVNGHTSTAAQDSFLLIDCYRPHAYSTDTGCDALWCHFDGPMARSFCDAVTGRLGNSFSLTDSYPAVRKLRGIFHVFAQNQLPKEPLLSKSINDILTVFLLYTPLNTGSENGNGIAEEIISYINEHFAENLSVEQLASMANLSQYHFIRTFRRETGFTPHEYIVNIRMSNAKYLLKNSSLSVKDICFRTGFSCESIFCSAFKKHHGLTPSAYRESENTCIKNEKKPMIAEND